MKERVILISTSDVERLKLLCPETMFDFDSFKLIDGLRDRLKFETDVWDEVFFPRHVKKLVFSAPIGKTVLFVINSAVDDARKRVEEICDTNGIAYSYVTINFL